MLPDRRSPGQPGRGYNPPPPLEPPAPPPLGWVTVSPAVPDAEFGLLVEGDAMAPDFPHGCVAVCGPWREGGSAERGRCYAFDLAGRPLPVLLILAGWTADAILVRQAATPGRVYRLPRSHVLAFAPVLAVEFPDAAADAA